MIDYLLEMFGVSLLLTLMVELIVAWGLGLRGKKYILLVILVNVLTNPAAVLFCWLGFPQLPVELAVVFVEAAVYGYFARDGRWKLPNPWLLSILCNGISWGTGILISQIGG